jgi:hypothetical protein
MTTTKTKRELAAEVLHELFRERRRIAIAEAVEAAGRLDVSKRTVQRAAHDLGVREVHNGSFGAFWELPGSDPVGFGLVA